MAFALMVRIGLCSNPGFNAAKPLKGNGMSKPAPYHLEAASTMAVIAASSAPLLYLDGELTVIAASLSFLEAFGVAASEAEGRKLSEVGGGDWSAPQLQVLLNSTATGLTKVEAYEMDLVRSDATSLRLVIGAHKIDYEDEDTVRLLVCITDVTKARAAEASYQAVLRENAIMLREVQHRIANSLQIIASILMQSARQVQSDDARGQLRNAHHRVMSIASVQRLLSASADDQVALKPYLTQLCDSLAASMIGDPALVLLAVAVDDSVLPASVSVSVGLLVTELVINALKHAFPDQRHGLIKVGYRSNGASWTLTVEDDGIGMGGTSQPSKAGLGTSIVEALTRQLLASVTVLDAQPGTMVRITHEATPALQPPTAL